jgi:hypothetical protein
MRKRYLSASKSSNCFSRVGGGEHTDRARALHHDSLGAALRRAIAGGRLLGHDVIDRGRRTTRFEVARQLGDDVPAARRRGLAESLGDQNVDLGFGWPIGDE